ncbi:MAG: S9 family peptidase [Saprospiraceae bacterium]|nr:S9 family peptidase [Saprospiraceae bacterium]
MDEQNLPGDPTLPSSPEEIQLLVNEGEGDFKYSVEDFFRNPEQSNFKISPNGDYLSFVKPVQNRKNVFVRKIDDEEATQITFEVDRDIAGYAWANNNRIIFVKDAGGDENFTLLAVDRDGSHAKDLTPYEAVRIEIIDMLEDHEDEIIIGMNKNNPQLFDPYRLNIVTGALEQLASNDNPMEPISGWQTDHDGRLRLAGKVRNGTETVVLYRDHEDEDFREVITTDFTESLSALFFDFEHDHIVYAASNLGTDKVRLIQFDMQQGQEVGEVLYEHDEVDIGGLSYSRKHRKLTAISYTTDKTHRVFLDPQTKEHYQFLQASLPGYEIAIGSHNKDETVFIVRTYSDRSLGAFYLYRAESRALTKITEVSPWLDETDLAPMKPVQYTSRDGLTINGYLSLPVGVEHKNLPVIINPHGGPWVRDSWGYNPEVQLWTQRGYAVLKMNYRGSTGYGKKFWKSSFKEWGKAMQDDVTDGVHWLIDQGIADPNKVAIYGGSYGGYATLAGVAFTPDLYCCAIDYVGVSNLLTFLSTIPPYWKPYLEMMYAMVGHPEDDEEYMRSSSPVFHVDRIKTPLLVAQGANDPRVNIDESDQIVSSLRARGIDVPYLVRYDEGHGFHNEENRFVFYKAALGFFKKYLG